MSRITLSYFSASTNRFSQAAAISSSSCLAYGSSNLVAFWNVANSRRGVYEILTGHDGLVTCVLFLDDTRLISADDKGVICSWRKSRSQWTLGTKVQAHKSAVAALCVHGNCLATGSSDATIKIWEVLIAESSDEIKQVQVISLRGNYPLSLAVSTLPQSKAVILVCGGTDRNIQVWTRSGELFVHSTVLSGHEDWVKSLAFSDPLALDDALVLASGSQDTTIRLWRIVCESSSSKAESKDISNDDVLDNFELSLNDTTGSHEGGRQISLKRHVLVVKFPERSQQFSVTFDALLVGHEAGVTSLRWQPVITATQTLLSTSTDSSLILWSPSSVIDSQNQSSCIWISRQRFGDIGGQRLGGFVGGLWAQGGREALAWGWGGGWRRWRCETLTDKVDEDWNEVGAVSGHSGPIKGIHWSPKGEFLISAGLDQTTRIHAAIPGIGDMPAVWNELARPQVHGYNLHGVVFLDALRFVSIADEKVARVFEAPRSFITVVEGLDVARFAPEEHERPATASVPPLGLSNKAVNEISSQRTESFGTQTTIRRPFEGELASQTLWPEVEKLFGHGYELVTLAVSKSRRLIATACKATTAEHAVVRVYETGTWQLLGKPLQGHTLTVTRIAFSPDDKFILTVSRDRTWRLFCAQDDGKSYEPIASDKSHARIIWDCEWTHEGDVFATASRDKTVRIWRGGSDTGPRKWTNVATIKTKEAATAFSFSAVDQDEKRYLAIGLETGDILIYSNKLDKPSHWVSSITFDSRIRHVDHIHQLAWRPGNNNQEMQLASCSEDGTLRIFSIKIARSVDEHKR